MTKIKTIKTKPAPALVMLWATKKPKAKSPPAWMPDEVTLLLEGDPGPKGLLITAGWTTPAARSCHRSPSKKWSKARLEANLERLAASWAEEVSKGWVLEIR